MPKLSSFVWVCFVVVTFTQVAGAQEATIRKAVTNDATSSDREQDGLTGPVRRVRIETAKVVVKDGASIEGSRVMRGVTTYDANGRKIDTVAHPVEGSAPSGKEQYRYDDQGNIVEMVVRGNDGSILSKEIYQYEFDELGNWKKMTTSVAVYEDGKLSFEPVEVTYRMITYYYSQAIDKMTAASTSKPTSLSAQSVSPAPPKSVSGSQTAGGDVARESTPVSNEQATVAVVGGEGNRGENKNPVNSAAPPGPADDTSSKNSSSKTSETGSAPAASIEVPSVSPDKTYDSVAPNKGIPAAERPTQSANESGMATLVNDPASRPNLLRPVSSGTDSAVPSVAPSSDSSTDSSEDAGHFYTQVLSHLRAGRYSEAVAALRQAVDRNPEDAVAYTKLGLAYSALRRPKETVAAFKLAIRIKAQVVDAESYYRLGTAYASLTKHSEAVGAFKQAMSIIRGQMLESDPSKYAGFPTLPDLHYDLALAYHNLGRYGDAIKELKEATTLKPDFAEAYYGLALAYIGLGDRKSAAKQEQTVRPLNKALADKINEALHNINSVTIICRGLGCPR